MARKRRKTKPQLSNKDEYVLHHSTYEVTYEPILEPSFRRLPKRVKDRVEPLLYEARRHPEKTIPELLDLIKRYPRVPVFYNYLSIAYNRMGDSEKEEEAVLANIKKNPNYLFAKINYTQLLLHRKEYEKIAELFNHKFDLQQLYPKRKQFHISEVVNFMGIIGIYFYEIGEYDAAQVHYEILQDIAPKEPASKMLKRKLHPSIFKCLVAYFSARREKKLNRLIEKAKRFAEENQNRI